MWDWKRGCGGHFGFINFIKFSYFQLIALKPGIYKSHCISRGVFECLHGIFIFCPTKLRPGIGIASNVRPNRRLSAFRFRSRSWKPVDGFFNVAHTHPLWGLDVPFGVFTYLNGRPSAIISFNMPDFWPHSVSSADLQPWWIYFIWHTHIFQGV